MTRSVNQVGKILRCSVPRSNAFRPVQNNLRTKTSVILLLSAASLFAFGFASQAGQQQEQAAQYRGFDGTAPAKTASTSWREHKNYVLLFASDKYDNWPALTNPVPDAQAIAKVLADDYGFVPEVVTNPSRNDILTALKKYQKMHFDNGDQLLIFFAGHGSYDEDDRQGYIVARDTKSESEDTNRLTYESYDDLQAKIDAIPVKHLLLVLDACFGGAFDKHIGDVHMRGDGEYSDAQLPELFANKVDSTTRKYLTSGGKTYVPDGAPGKHSPFVRNLLFALASGGGDKGYLTFANILAGVEATKPEPYAGDWGESDPGSDFFFISKNLPSSRTPGSHPGGNSPTYVPVAPTGTRHSIAILGLKDLSPRGEDSWVPAAFSEELTTELLGGDLRPIAGEDVTKAKTDLALQDSSGYSRDTLAKLQKILGADWVVSGAYSKQGNQPGAVIRVDLRVQDSQSGEIIAQDGEQGTVAGLSDLVRQAGSRLRDKLGVQLPPEEGQRSPEPQLPATAEASKYYAEGLAKLRAYDLLSARDLLKQAVTADPKFALAHAALADAWFQLGYDDNAKEEAKNAFDLSTGLPLETRLIIEGSYRQKNSDWDTAAKDYSDLWRFYPDDTDYALELASVQTAAGKGTDALATLDNLRGSSQRGAAEPKSDPRVDFEEAVAAESLSDAKHQQSAAARAAEEASQQGSRLLVAESYWQECTAFFALNDLKSAEDVCQKANQASDYAGGQQVKARSLTMLSRILATEGKTSEAMALDENVLQMVRQIGSRKDVIGALMNLANLQATEGQVAEAQKNDQEAIGIAREIGDKQQLFDLENNLAADTITRGDYKEARTSLDAALTTAREAGNQAEISQALQNLGAVVFQLGDLTVAEKDVRQALVTSQNANVQSETATGFGDLGDIQMAKGDLAEARKNYEEELKLFTTIGDQPNIAASKLSLAKLAVEQANSAEAEDLARQAIQEFQAEKLVDSEGDARNTLARALIAQGKLPDAEGELESAAKIGVQDFATKISLAITGARLKARTGKSDEARQELDSQLAAAKDKNLVGLQFEVRLALAEIEAPPDSKSPPQSKGATLVALETEARNSGYVLVATKAAHLQASPSH